MALRLASIQTLSGTTVTWDALYKFAKITASGNVAVTLSNVGAPDGGVLHFKQDTTGSRTLTINSSSITVNTDPTSITRVEWSFDGTDYVFTSSTGGSSSGGAAQLTKPVLTLTVLSSTSIKADWTASANASSYLVQLASDSAFTAIISSQTIAAGTLTYTFSSGITNMAHYYIRVKAVGDSVTYSDSAYDSGAATAAASVSYTTLSDVTFTAVSPYSFFTAGGGAAAIDTDGGISKAHLTAPSSTAQANLYKNSSYTVGDIIRITLTGVTVVNGTPVVRVGDGSGSFTVKLVSGTNTFIINTTGAEASSRAISVAVGINSFNTLGEVFVRGIKIEKQ